MTTDSALKYEWKHHSSKRVIQMKLVWYTRTITRKYQPDKNRHEKSLQLKFCKLFVAGAPERTWTFTSGTLDPKSSASANSATGAYLSFINAFRINKKYYSKLPAVCQGNFEKNFKLSFSPIICLFSGVFSQFLLDFINIVRGYLVHEIVEPICKEQMCVWTPAYNGRVCGVVALKIVFGNRGVHTLV